jgi:anthranilate synthase component 1
MLTQLDHLLYNRKTNEANLAPVVRELPADLETPVSVYMKLAGDGPSFLLESVTGGEQLARYSFIGVDPRQAFVLNGGGITSHDKSGQTHPLPCADPLAILQAVINHYQPLPAPDLPRFAGGLVGYLGYDVVRYCEPTASARTHPLLPEGILLLADSLIAFDHAYGRMLLIANAHLDEGVDQAYAKAEAQLDALQARLKKPLPAPAVNNMTAPAIGLQANQTHEAFHQAVLEAKQLIAAGEIFQVVLSQRLQRQTHAAPFDIYRALRRLNPSPYMFFFDFGDLAGSPDFYLIGASPELHVRLEGRRAAIRPIAGTRPRGLTPEDDLRLEQELLADPKERAEHVMLVDLARNDLGRVCEYGSVQVSEQMTVERYSHVMHIVSHVTGRLRPELDAFDLLRATFPAGTVSGAPKIRAMQIIDALEPEARGPYAGVAGYFAYDGSSDTCITIRTLALSGGVVSVQAGAGIVADSEPDREYQESLNKAQALLAAVERAEKNRP